MNKLVFAAAMGSACLLMTSCEDRGAADQNNMTGEVAPAGPMAEGDTTVVVFPNDARIVEEDGVTFRINPDGTRVRLGPTDSRIVVEDGVRYRVDPDGTRVRIDDDGLRIDLPDVDVGTSTKGNLDIDVGDKDADGGR